MDVRVHADPRPVPAPDDVSRFYWEAAANHRLVLQRCRECHKMQYPPEICCVHCQGEEFEHTETTGRGVIYSYSVVNRPLHAGFVDALPYVVALIELDDQPWSADGDKPRVRSFANAGVMTTNAGLVLRALDGQEFQFTIVRSG